MDRHYIKHTGTFTAHSEDGTKHTILEYTDFIETQTRGGVETLEGFKSLKTSNEELVNRIDKGKYTIIGGLHRDQSRIK